MSASSVLGIIGASLALADALLSPSTNATTKTTQKGKETSKSSYTQTAKKDNSKSTQVYQTNNGNRQNQVQTTQYRSGNSQSFGGGSTSYQAPHQFTPPNRPVFVRTEMDQGTQNNNPATQTPPANQGTFTPVQPTTVAQPPTVTQPQTVAQTKPADPPPPPKKVEPSEEEKFIMGFLPTLYSGDKEAIKKNTDGCEEDDELSDLIIEDLMKFSEKAEAHQGFASAKVTSRETAGDHIALSTTVTFKDETTSGEVFNVSKDKNGNLKYYVE